jgi:hypothetical protein
MPDLQAIQEYTCCPGLRRWKMPCVHKLMTRKNQGVTPWLCLSDFPSIWILPRARPQTRSQDSFPPVKVVHDQMVLKLADEYLKETWDRDLALAVIGPIIDAAPSDQAARQWLIELRYAWDHASGLPSAVADGPPCSSLADPVHPPHPGSSFRHPSWSSPLSFIRKGRILRRERRKPTCGYCQEVGHTRRGCRKLRRDRAAPASGHGRT